MKTTTLALAGRLPASGWLLAFALSIACLSASYQSGQSSGQSHGQSHGKHLNSLIEAGFVILDPDGYEVERFDE